MVVNIFEIENAYINTQHPDFIGTNEAMLNLFDDGEEESEAEQNEFKSKQYSLLDKNKNPQEFQVIEEEKKEETSSSIWNMFGRSKDNRVAQPLEDKELDLEAS